MRGSTEGGLWALIVGGVGLSVASLVAEPPAGNAPPVAPQTISPEVAELEPVTPTPEVAARDATEPVAQSAPLVVEAPKQDMAEVEVTQAQPPTLVSDVSVPLQAPESGTAPDLTPDASQRPLVVGTLDPLFAPAATELPAIDTTPATPPVASLSEPVEDNEGLASIAQIPEPAPEPTADELAQALNLEVALPEEPPTVDTSEAAVATILPAPEIETPSPDSGDAEQVASEQPSSSAVRINRPTTETSDVAGQDAVIVELESEVVDLPALEAFAATFENPDELAPIAIVLIDDGTVDDGPAALANLGFVPTVAINALSDDATERMTAYRAAGFEVALQFQLPGGAQPSDIEVAYAAVFEIMPEAAMLFSDGAGVMQNNRSATGQVMEILAAEGYGLVAVQRGLGNATRAAEQAGVPAATIVRDLDGNGESSGAISRALDQAAFRARQSGGAVLLGRMQQDTLTALEQWAKDASRDDVVPAPVSAILLAQAATD